MTAADLKTRTVRDLASMAKRKKVPGWHSMKKDELIKALLQQARAEAGRKIGESKRKSARVAVAAPVAAPVNRPTPTPAKPRVSSEEIHARLSETVDPKDLTFRPLSNEEALTKERLVVMVRDPYWLHAYWELGRKSIERAKVALGQYWHVARPILRLYEVYRDGTTTSTRQPVRDVEIHGGVSNWYIDVHNPPKCYQLDIGYLAVGGRFFCLARSNVVHTPPAAAADNFDRNWADVAKDFDRIFALSGGYSESESNGDLREVLEERLKRPIGDPMTTQFGRGAAGFLPDETPFEFEVDTELIVHGVTRPDAYVTLHGEPVKVRSDGTFAVRFNLPDRRCVLPMVASSRDGAEQRTVVLAVDRNTKVMDPVSREGGE